MRCADNAENRFGGLRNGDVDEVEGHAIFDILECAGRCGAWLTDELSSAQQEGCFLVAGGAADRTLSGAASIDRRASSGRADACACELASQTVAERTGSSAVTQPVVAIAVKAGSITRHVRHEVS
jgi:hypothetical protein